MDGHKRVGGRETLAGSQGELGIALDSDARLGCANAQRQTQEPRLRLDVSDREPDIATPDVHDRRPAPVVGGIHAHEVALLESGRCALHPVAPVLVTGATEGAERRTVAGYG
jgi:hypothetical protein